MWKERKEADLERKVMRGQQDRRFQGLRTKSARRVLVALSALIVIAIIPAFTQAGSIPGIIATAVAFGLWWLLRISVRTVADLPDRFLDERQRAQRDRAYLDAFRIYGFVISGLATVGLVAFVVVQEGDQVTLTTTWNQALGLAMFVIVFPVLLPSMSLAWRDAGEPHEAQ